MSRAALVLAVLALSAAAVSASCNVTAYAAAALDYANCVSGASTDLHALCACVDVYSGKLLTSLGGCKDDPNYGVVYDTAVTAVHAAATNSNCQQSSAHRVGGIAGLVATAALVGVRALRWA